MHVPVLAALGLLAPLVAAGMYSAPVIELDANSFKQVMAKEHASMVAFVAPWCGHCKSLGPEYTAAAGSLAPLVPFYFIDCDQDKNKPVCGQYRIEGFPTIKAFPRGSKGAARDYQGERKRSGLVEYAKSLVPDRVKKLRADEGAEKVLDKFLGEKSELPHALLVHPSAPSIPFLWKVLGHRLSNKAQLGYIRDTPKHEVLSAVGVDVTSGDSARLIYWAGGAERGAPVVYDGALKFNALLEWLEAAIDGEAPPAAKPKKAKEDKKGKNEDTEDTIKEEPVSETAKPKPKDTDDAASRRARLQAKMDEEERRDRLRREKMAQKAAERAAAEEAERETKASPVDAPAAEPSEDVTEEDAPLTVEEEPTGATGDEWDFLTEDEDKESKDATPVDAPPAEPEEDEHKRDEL